MTKSMQETIADILRQSAEVKKRAADTITPPVERVAKELIAAYKRGNKLVIFGNGGSAADAQHIATEFVHQFERKRPALPAIILHGNTSSLTSIGNDWGFDDVFARQIEAFVQKGDIVIALSTSGNSRNILAAVKKAKERGAFVIGFSNENGGGMKPLCDLCILVPDTNTARVQECHITVGHIICKLVEDELYPEAGGKVAP